MDAVEYMFFIPTPQRCDEQPLWSVSGNPVQYDMGGYVFNTCHDELTVCFLGKDWKWGTLIFGSQICVF